MEFIEENNILDSLFNSEGCRFETVMFHAGQEEPDTASDARTVPIYLTMSYVSRNCDDAADVFALRSGGNIYSS